MLRVLASHRVVFNHLSEFRLGFLMEGFEELVLFGRSRVIKQGNVKLCNGEVVDINVAFHL